MKVGLDLDGCLANFDQAFIQVLVEVTGKNLFPAGYRPHCWEFPTSCGYTKEEELSAWRKVWESEDFWAKLAPLPGMQDLLQSELTMNQDHDVYFITQRAGYQVKEQTEVWLMQNGVFPSTVLISGKKGLVCEALALDVYIDDKLSNIASVHAYSPKTRAYLLNQPWNQERSGMVVVNTVGEMLRLEGLYAKTEMA